MSEVMSLRLAIRGLNKWVHITGKYSTDEANGAQMKELNDLLAWCKEFISLRLDEHLRALHEAMKAAERTETRGW